MSQFAAKVLLDSVNPLGTRLTTFEVTYPRFIHSELLTHRAFSRNSASSRAIPVAKMLQRVQDNPVVPLHWGMEQKGMQAGDVVPPDVAADAERIWRKAHGHALECARELAAIGIHKQIVNRLVEPFMWITVLVSTTSFKHFRRLRVHPAAEPHFQKIAGMMADVYDASNPQSVQWGARHLPLTGHPGDENLSTDDLVKVCVGRCARVSYLTHDGRRDTSEDLRLYSTLETNGHWSPFEHAARADAGATWSGNFTGGWLQYRKTFQTEFVPDGD